MKQFNFHQPTEIVFGSGRVAEAGEIVNLAATILSAVGAVIFGGEYRLEFDVAAESRDRVEMDPDILPRIERAGLLFERAPRGHQ